MLLASKSNYQNIVEGTSLPGVQYPESLHSGLNSKRASHKVAEQGRRNRINEALKEMHSLIPSPSASRSAGIQTNGEADGSPLAGEDDGRPDSNSKESKEDAAVRSNSSKAATVELANEYIRIMQKDSEAKSADLETLRLENEKLKKRLAEQSGSQTDSPEHSMESASTPVSAKAQ